VRVYLIGFMGAGKSTIGPLLADRLGVPFHDLDDLVVDRAGATIAEIFARDGEARFRDLEVAALADIDEDAVVSLGGGAFMTEAVRELVSARGTSIYLDWPLEVLAQRVAGDPERPLAADPEQFRQRYASRVPTYRQADLVWRSRPPYRETVAQVVDDLVALSGKAESGA